MRPECHFSHGFNEKHNFPGLTTQSNNSNRPLEPTSPGQPAEPQQDPRLCLAGSGWKAEGLEWASEKEECLYLSGCFLEGEEVTVGLSSLDVLPRGAGTMRRQASESRVHSLSVPIPRSLCKDLSSGRCSQVRRKSSRAKLLLPCSGGRG